MTSSTKLKIKDKKLRQLDKKILDFCRKSAFYRNSYDLSTSEKWKIAIDELEKELSGIQPMNKFDDLVYRNIKFILSTTKVEYDFSIKLNFSVEEWVNENYGDFAWATLEEKVRNYDFKLSSIIDELQEKVSYIPTGSKTVERRIKKDINLIKENAIAYMKGNGILPQNFDCEVDIVQEDNVYWDLNSKRIVFSFNILKYYLKNKKIKLDPCKGYFAMFHELGHAAHQIYSAKLPCSLAFSREIATVRATGAIYEGIAKEREKEALDYLKSNSKKLGLDTKNITLAELYFKEKQQLNVRIVYEELLALKKIRNPAFDVESKLKDILGNILNEVWIRYKAKEIESSHLQNLGYLSHVFGVHHIERVKSRLEEKFGKKWIEQNKARVNEALTTGSWTWKVYPEFVEWYLEENFSHS